MPIREYECPKCGHREERLELAGDRPLRKCPQCGGRVQRLMSAPAFQFKGSGWYVTDYARKGGGAENGSSAAKASDSGEKSSGDQKGGSEAAKAESGAGGTSSRKSPVAADG